MFSINKPIFRSASPPSVVGSLGEAEGRPPLSVATDAVVGSSVYDMEVTNYKSLSFSLACVYIFKDQFVYGS